VIPFPLFLFPSSLNSILENDNLRNEYATLFSHVEKDIPWARIALQASPEAINLWIGNSRSVTALHKDNYENVYVQIIGEKHFCLLPPVAYACVAERELRPASYVSLDFSTYIHSTCLPSSFKLLICHRYRLLMVMAQRMTNLRYAYHR
jgi:hypothetical protein